MRNTKKKFLLITFWAALALAQPAKAQAGLQIDSLFSGLFTPSGKVTESVVSGKEVKPYNLDYFRSIRFPATEAEIGKVVSWIESDSLLASEKEFDSEGGKLTYALLSFPPEKGRNRYLGFQVKEAGRQRYVTVVYLKGKATTRDLKVIFKKR